MTIETKAMVRDIGVFATLVLGLAALLLVAAH